METYDRAPRYIAVKLMPDDDAGVEYDSLEAAEEGERQGPFEPGEVVAICRVECFLRPRVVVDRQVPSE